MYHLILGCFLPTSTYSCSTVVREDGVDEAGKKEVGTLLRLFARRKFSCSTTYRYIRVVFSSQDFPPSLSREEVAYLKYINVPNIPRGLIFSFDFPVFFLPASISICNNLS